MEESEASVKEWLAPGRGNAALMFIRGRWRTLFIHGSANDSKEASHIPFFSSFLLNTPLPLRILVLIPFRWVLSTPTVYDYPHCILRTHLYRYELHRL